MRQKVSNSRVIQSSSAVPRFVSERYLTRACQLIVRIAVGCLMVKDFLRMCVRGVMSFFKNGQRIATSAFIALIVGSFLTGGFSKGVEVSGDVPRAFLAPGGFAREASFVPAVSGMTPRDEIQKIRVQNDYRVRMAREQNRLRKDLMNFVGQAVRAVR